MVVETMQEESLSYSETSRRFEETAGMKRGCVDILVNNAGVSEITPFMSYAEEDFDRVMDLNVKGVFNTTRSAVECMVARGSGILLNTSSIVSIYGQPEDIANAFVFLATEEASYISGVVLSADGMGRT